jgi:hypothetical protein
VLGFSREDREKLLEVHLCVPKMAGYLERVDFSRFEDLAGHDPEEVGHRINLCLERPYLDAMGVKSLSNLIQATGTGSE